MRRIGKFRMTDHFLYRMWDRKAEQSIIEIILSQVEPLKRKTILVVSRQVMKKEFGFKSEELFIVVDKTKLVTYYFCDFTEFFKCKRNSEIKLIQEIKNHKVA